MREKEQGKSETIAMSLPIMALTAACWTTGWAMVFWFAYRLVN
jgi:hypothetical protein